jgi:uncharacterized protein (DUF302 family)
MKEFTLKELQHLREAMEISLKSDEDFKSALKKLDDELAEMGYKLNRKAFENSWIKIQNKK